MVWIRTTLFFLKKVNGCMVEAILINYYHFIKKRVTDYFNTKNGSFSRMGLAPILIKYHKNDAKRTLNFSFRKKDGHLTHQNLIHSIILSGPTSRITRNTIKLKGSMICVEKSKKLKIKLILNMYGT